MIPLQIAVALAYALFGLLSLQLAAPPGYAVPIFPSAGIALLAVLTYGNRVLPAVWLGSLIMQIGAGFNAGFNGSAWTGIIAAPFGATLQAFAGAWLMRRLIGWPNPLDRLETIARFFCVVAPVGCLVSASMAVPVLVLAGGVPAKEALFNWWTWWIGDTLGVVVAMPLILVFLGQPAADWRPRRLAVALPLTVALVLTGIAYFQVERWEEQRIASRFQRETEHSASLIKARLDAQLDMILAIQGWAMQMPSVTRENFNRYTATWLDRYPGTQNFGWAMRVPHAERGRFEAALGKEMKLSSFQLKDRDASGKLFPSAVASEYLPLTYLEPLATNQRALGLNVLALPATAEAVRRTIQSGRPEASQPLRLVQENGSQQGVVVYQVVPASGSGKDQFRAVISGVFRMGDVIATTLRQKTTQSIDLCLIDLSAPAHNRYLVGPKGCDDDAWLQGPLLRRTQLSFGDRPWEIRQRATPAYVAELRSWAAWVTIAVGLNAVGLLGAFLLITSGSTRRIAGLVTQRTAELTAATRRLEEQQAALTDAQRIARLGSWEWEPEDQFIRCSSEMGRLLDSDVSRLALNQFPELFHDEDAPTVAEVLRDVREQMTSRSLDARPRQAASGVEVLHLQIESQWKNGALIHLRGTLQDVTAIRAAEAHIHYLAHYDTLTGLPNRSYWLSRAKSALAAAQRHQEKLAVLFLDLDQFKTVNDSLGHPVGDQLLAAVSRKLAQCLRGEDLLARLGGDEFVVLLERVEHPDDAGAVARKMLSALSQPILVEGHELTLTVSIGIALFPNDGQNIDHLLQQADVAMYSAKSQGRNNYQFFVPDMTVRAAERLTVEAALRRALERQEFELHYQPQIEPHTGRVCGAEALIRWRHPERGLTLPGQFITVAEDSGLILPLGTWVLEEVFRQQVAWAAKGLPPVRLAANISGLQFIREDFADSLERLLAQTGADPKRLELELTESTLMEPDWQMLDRLDRLRQLGFTLALDDFGTGYSSLSYLKRLPITRLKVDRSFVRDLPGDAEDAAIATATLSLARDLGMEVVAEGVESEAQFSFLLERGCQAMQGYLFARPLTVDAFEEYLKIHGSVV